ncbi:MAG TPA: hypothetical protein VHT27_09270 [Solirubrobacteraceae bacterium]|jgi:hypothetical protein|nr:hypothetical protein [Solirubrobacteraceae bacterium]
MHPRWSRRRPGARPAARACARLAAALALCAGLAGCGSGAKATAAREGPQTSCQATVVEDLARVVKRVYREGVHSERTVVAERYIDRSAPLAQAVAAGNAAAAQAAAQQLVATGKLTNLRVLRAGALLAEAGGPALAPIYGSLGKPGGAAGTYVTSVWSDEGFLAEAQGISSSAIALRAGDRNIGGSFALPVRKLPHEGSIVVGGVPYEYASFGATAFPDGAIRVYLVRSIASTAEVCAPTREQTTYETLSRIARLIYEGEAGKRTQPQVQRVQHNAALLAAVAKSEPLAARKAVELLLHEHIVRLRVYDAAGKLLVDDGGPYVLAPVSAPLIQGGRKIGHFVLSIQDDEGYLRLTRRLAGLRVLMYMNSPSGERALVKNSLGPEPGSVPERGRYSYRGATYQVYTVHAQAFPSGPLTINVLIPVPYT